MRNVMAYPITVQEVVDCLKKFKENLNPDLIGDMRPWLLDIAIEVVEKQGAEIVESHKIVNPNA